MASPAANNPMPLLQPPVPHDTTAPCAGGQSASFSAHPWQLPVPVEHPGFAPWAPPGHFGTQDHPPAGVAGVAAGSGELQPAKVAKPSVLERPSFASALRLVHQQFPVWLLAVLILALVTGGATLGFHVLFFASGSISLLFPHLWSSLFISPLLAITVAWLGTMVGLLSTVWGMMFILRLAYQAVTTGAVKIGDGFRRIGSSTVAIGVHLWFFPVTYGMVVLVETMPPAEMLPILRWSALLILAGLCIPPLLFATMQALYSTDSILRCVRFGIVAAWQQFGRILLPLVIGLGGFVVLRWAVVVVCPLLAVWLVAIFCRQQHPSLANQHHSVSAVPTPPSPGLVFPQ
ncbi:hypothetical protein ACFPVT_06635 [Corynebacterium choanae]|uniref:Uncharacterized protein n=1 Tax=Corynebacterium choanae TaxID=1862358 RepID=A0A3G6J6M5_9CORY|nr:hypothetical protein [Corynebacterium choanae]AZA13755.1 hypothetical protein CCHOA_06815 [Corynebacterium choanae]